MIGATSSNTANASRRRSGNTASTIPAAAARLIWPVRSRSGTSGGRKPTKPWKRTSARRQPIRRASRKERARKPAKGPTRTSRPPARNSESYEQLEEDDPDAAVDNWKESIDYVARAADSAGRKALRRVEDTVYQNVMTQLAPYYFDNELVSANIQQSTRNGDAGEQFVFEVNVNDDELKEKVSDRLAEYDDEIDRWHVEVEKDTDAAEAIEGAEPPPEPEPEDNSRSTTN